MHVSDIDTIKVVRWKLSRIRRGNPIRTLDLFAGCGGFSLGFQRAGFLLAGAVEKDPAAASTYAANFFRDCSDEIREIHARPRDISKTDPADLCAELDLKPSLAGAIDVIIAGPPCQAYARVGRAKLRQVYGDPQAYKRDTRANLYLRLLDYVHAFRPLAVLLENVPDALNYGGCNIAEVICDELETMGYVCAYTLLNAVFYGVPQIRERMFLLALHQELARTPTFPRPTHWCNLPRGYSATRSVALKSVLANSNHEQHFLVRGPSHYVAPPASPRSLVPAVSAEEAIGDLPPITYHLNGGMKGGTRKFTTLAKYDRRRRVSHYAAMMRNWPGYENSEGVRDHVIRWLPRDFDIFRRMQPGDQYPEAHRLALALFSEKLESSRRGGRVPRPGTAEYERLKKQTVPPYDASKFPNKWWKIEPTKPVRTLTAHLGKDSYTHIHYDSSQARTISVREAARLQSFPDGFLFSPTMNAAFTQIGNAVPPLLAFAIALEIRKALEGR